MAETETVPPAFAEASAGKTIVDSLLHKVRKKGRPSWQAFDALSIKDEWKDKRLKYRWVDMDPMKIYKREQMGYVLANPESGGALSGTRASDPLGNTIGSTPTARDLVLMVADASIEEEYGKEIARRTDHTVLGMKSNRQDEFEKLGREHGITGARLNTRMVIE